VIAARILFWGSLGGLVWTHAAYPLAARLAASLRTRSVRRDEDELPSVALIVTAYNEEAVIERRLENLLELRRVYLELERLRRETEPGA